MGNSSTAVDIIFDTASDWLAIPDVTCFKCSGRTYNTSLSGPPLFVMTDDKAYYGSNTSLFGKTFKDKVCIDASPPMCV